MATSAGTIAAVATTAETGWVRNNTRLARTAWLEPDGLSLPNDENSLHPCGESSRLRRADRSPQTSQAAALAQSDPSFGRHLNTDLYLAHLEWGTSGLQSHRSSNPKPRDSGTDARPAQFPLPSPTHRKVGVAMPNPVHARFTLRRSLERGTLCYTPFTPNDQCLPTWIAGAY